jgi:acetate kinase
MTNAVIVPNAGSTDLKLGAYGVDATKTLPLLCRGQIDSTRGDPHFVVEDKNDKPLDVQAWGEGQAINHKTALQFVITWLESKIARIKVVAVHADAGAAVTVTDALLRPPTPQRGRREHD